jgi:predicted amidohydrolase YtcJ
MVWVFFFNAKVWQGRTFLATGTENFSNWMCIYGSRIHSIGSYEQGQNNRLAAVVSATAAGCEIDKISEGNIIDLDGKRVLPGLHDAHIHAYELGRLASTVDLEGCRSIKDIQQTLKQWCINHPVPTTPPPPPGKENSISKPKTEALHAGFVEGNHWCAYIH